MARDRIQAPYLGANERAIQLINRLQRLVISQRNISQECTVSSSQLAHVKEGDRHASDSLIRRLQNVLAKRSSESVKMAIEINNLDAELIATCKNESLPLDDIIRSRIAAAALDALTFWAGRISWHLTSRRE